MPGQSNPAPGQSSSDKLLSDFAKANLASRRRRMDVILAHRRRVEGIAEEEEEETNPWARRDEWKQKQYDYVVPYQAEYKIEDPNEILNQNLPPQQEGALVNWPTVEQDGRSHLQDDNQRQETRDDERQRPQDDLISVVNSDDTETVCEPTNSTKFRRARRLVAACAEVSKAAQESNALNGRISTLSLSSTPAGSSCPTKQPSQQAQASSQSAIPSSTELPLQDAANSFNTPAPRSAPRTKLSLKGTESVVDFDKLSTIQAPTELINNDYDSNVSVEEIRKDFFRDYKTNSDLPIYASRSFLINSINSFNVVIVEGSTGCGKTTQVPMYILEDAILNKKSARAPVIYVTQPRRIAARSIANRVCNEHGWDLGTLVGYQIGLEKKVGPQTILVFCTAGVLLQKLINEKTLQNFSHIIVDEAHERDADTDLLLMMIRTLMKREMSRFRLIVMSATINTEKLRGYFTFRADYGQKLCIIPSIVLVDQIARQQKNKIQTFYIDTLSSSFKIENSNLEMDIDQPDITDDRITVAAKIIVDVIPRLETFRQETQSTIVFLPGMAEIHKMYRLLNGVRGLDVIPLHSCLPLEYQARVFLPARDNCRKVILATNIAESSITVSDAGFVVDFCLTKTLRKDHSSGFPTLRLQWSSRDQCTQRAGRTGRCCPGKVFRLVSEDFFKKFRDFAEPEILTAPLELSALRIKNFQMGEILRMFAVVLDPPPKHDIQSAILELKQIGALTSTYNGKLSDIDGDLTELGQIISALPIDVHLSKLIVLAAVFDVLEDAIIIAACLSTNRTVVKHLYDDPVSSYSLKLDWANGSFSDLFVSLDIYKEYNYYKHNQCKNYAWLDKFCQQRCLDERKLHEVYALVEELKSRLEGLNIKILEQPNRVRDHREDELMLKIACCAAFYPNYFLPEEFEPDVIDKALCGLDPTQTVVMHGFPVNTVPLYQDQIVSLLRAKIGCDFEYIADNSRALLVLSGGSATLDDRRVGLSIGDEGIVDNFKPVSRSVYTALRYGLTERTKLREYQDLEASRRMNYFKEKVDQVREQTNRLLPAWIKVLADRLADNRRLIESTDEEYAEITASQYYIEVENNSLHAEIDRQQLILMKKASLHKDSLMKNSDTDSNSQSGYVDEDNNDQAIFKSTLRPIRGPTSPVMLKFQSVLEKYRSYHIEIDSNSVNCIILHPEYHKSRRQMLVAAAIGQSRMGRLIARDTTLMPNIRGLPSLMALCFAQYIRLAQSEKLGCLVGAVFGLGWDENGKPINRKYEMELSFDVLISQDDIKLINLVRQSISKLTKFFEIHEAGAPRAELQRSLRDMMLTLIRARRQPLQEVKFVRSSGTTLIPFSDYAGL